MFQGFEEQDGTPGDIRRFERLWLIAMVLSVLVAIEMYDYTVMIVGAPLAAFANVVVFGVAVILMAYASRRRSNVARLLLLPFFGLIIAYDLSHYTAMMERDVTAYIMMGRLGLMGAAIYFLFTPASRAWFAGRLPAPDELQDS